MNITINNQTITYTSSLEALALASALEHLGLEEEARFVEASYPNFNMFNANEFEELEEGFLEILTSPLAYHLLHDECDGCYITE